MFAPAGFGNEPPGPPDAKMVQELKQRLSIVADPSKPLNERVEELHGLCGKAGFGHNAKEFREAGGIKALVQMATEGFPVDGDLTRSGSQWDAVAQCSPTMHHSLRRVAMGILAELSNYK